MTGKLAEEKTKATQPLRQATLVFLLGKNKVLLAMKKRGFGVGKWNGVGGKLKDGETTAEAAKRETFEEIGVMPQSIKEVAVLNFYFTTKPDWNQQVVVFVSKKWKGIPSESEEMKPEWFDLDKLPFDQMWEDDKYWLPKVLANQKLMGNFLFGDDGKISEFEII